MTLVALDLAVFHRISAENLASVVAALQALAILLVLQSCKQRLLFVWLSVMVAMHNVVGLTEQMAALSARGIVFSIDDFGAGHSSFARLLRIEVPS